jgi:hypothetical protein
MAPMTAVALMTGRPSLPTTTFPDCAVLFRWPVHDALELVPLLA